MSRLEQAAGLKFLLKEYKKIKKLLFFTICISTQYKNTNHFFLVFIMISFFTDVCGP